MRDGVRIAVDVYLPPHATPSATIVRPTRYYRGVALKAPFRRLDAMEWLLDHAAETRHRFLGAGYAWVDVCARGSGASFGSRPGPWSPAEVEDYGEILDWIVAQPWSNGRVGATGVSYDGTAAEMMLATGRPCLQAIAPRFSLFDVYADVAFPGGIHLSWFTAAWSGFNRALDEGGLDRAFARKLQTQLRALRDRYGVGASTWGEGPTADRFLRGVLRTVARGVRPVDDDRDGTLLQAARGEHEGNYDVHEGAMRVQHRDDADPSSPLDDKVIDALSPHRRLADFRASGGAVFGYSGWLDGAYQASACHRFQNLAGGRLILGPWDHGGTQNVSPYAPTRRSGFDHDGELLRFFDHHLRDRPDDTPPVRYFTVGEERWRSASTWPPPEVTMERWFVRRGGRLHRDVGDDLDDVYRVDETLGTGHRSRWDALLGLLAPVGYSRRADRARRMLVYRSAPLERPVTVTGHPVTRFRVRLSVPDAHLFAYLEEEREDGTVHYVTEGMLRASARAETDAPPYATPGPAHSFRREDARPAPIDETIEVAFAMLPVSWQFARRSRLRLAVAGADADHFAPPPFEGTTLTLCAGTCLELPVEAF
ncbi:MAG: CocE/NonD family hydrolase [Myxococcota bacterium]